MFAGNESNAQQYKLKQVNSVAGMKMESTIYVKGMRKRTESAGMMGMGGQTLIEQCDLKRTIKLNDKKKVYFIEPFSNEEVIDDDIKTAKTNVPVKQTNTEKGGTIYMYYNITDTGERKKMYGFNARHVWTTQKMKPSADACTMKDSMIIKTDGWYIDLPEFNCPVQYRPGQASIQPVEKPTCMDKFVTHRSGKGKLGFVLQQTTTMIMNAGKAQTSEFSTTLETLEFSSQNLDPALFDIPAGYTQVNNEAELQDNMSMNDIKNMYKNAQNNSNQPNVNDFNNILNPKEKKAGMIRIGVIPPKGDPQIENGSLQTYLASILRSGNIEAVAVPNDDEARSYNCDYTLSTDFIKVKQASKVGGLLKAIKNADPNASSSFNIENAVLLRSLADGSVKYQQTIADKYDGKIDEAAKRSVEAESQAVLKAIK